MKGIQELRHKHGWSQRELEKKSGVTQATISEIEQGRRPRPRYNTLKKLADAFGVSVPELYELSSPAPAVEEQPEEEPHELNEAQGRLELLEAHTADIMGMVGELDPENEPLDRIAMTFLEAKLAQIARRIAEKKDQKEKRSEMAGNPLANLLQETLDTSGAQVGDLGPVKKGEIVKTRHLQETLGEEVEVQGVVEGPAKTSHGEAKQSQIEEEHGASRGP